MMFGKRSPGLPGEENGITQNASECGSEVESVEDQIAETNGDGSEKPDLLEYLANLEDVVDPDGLELEPNGGEDAVTDEVPPKEKSRAELLAEHIRRQTKAEKVTPYTSLKADDADVDFVLEELSKQEELADISSAVGQKDTYYYSSRHMTGNYAMIAILVEEKDLAHTVAQMVRFNCKTYPAPTPLSCFTNHPYYFTTPQLNRVRDLLKKDPRYEDIGEVLTKNNKVYFHSVPTMSARYALALAEDVEYGEYGYR